MEDEEGEEVVAGKTGGNGHDLIGDRRHALDQDDPGAPFRVSGAERRDPLAIAIGRDQPMADGVVEQRADGIAHEAAEHRGDCADERIEPRFLRLASAMGTSMMSGGTGKNELSAKDTAASAGSAWRLAESAITLS